MGRKMGMQTIMIAAFLIAVLMSTTNILYVKVSAIIDDEICSLQASSNLSLIEWNMTYGGAGNDGASSIIQTIDGGFAIAGGTNSFGFGKSDFWLVKTDTNGNVQWNKTYGGAEEEVAYSVVQTDDGGYALAGHTYSFGMGNGDIWLVKTDANGEIQWNKTYGGTNWEESRCMIKTNDGGFAIAGFTSYGWIGNRDFLLIKTDANGNEQWNKTYGGSSSEEAYSIVQTVDGGYALLGTTLSFGAGNGDFWLIKTDSLGNVEWNKTYGEALYLEEGMSIIQTVDGGFALAGYKEGPIIYPYELINDDFWLVKTDSEGNVQWSKTYDQSKDDSARSLTQTSYEGYLLAGHTNSTGTLDFWIVKVNNGGLVQWNITLGGSGRDQASEVIHTSDGGYAIVGFTESYGAGLEDIWLVKLAPIPPIHDIAATNVKPFKSVVGQNYTTKIDLTVENQGDFTEAFNVTLYVNTTEIETKQIALANGATTTLTFTWNTNGFVKGNYTLWAYAWPVQGETETTDNTSTDVIVYVRIPGDLNADTYVNVKDAVILGAAFGSKPGDSNWNPNADINSDNIINVKDAVIQGVHFGQHDP
jgi:hypothetical protein